VRPETTVDIPADWLVQQPHLPDRCAKHGLPAVRRVGFAVRSRRSHRRTPPTGYSRFDSAAEYTQQVRVVEVSGWPLCAACVRQRTLGVTLAAVLFFGGLSALLAAALAGILTDRVGLPTVVVFAVGLATATSAPLVLRWGSLPQVTGSQATADGGAVRLTDPHPAFTASLPLAT
jgi:hypothetical protein